MHPHKRRPPSRSPTPSTSSLTPLPPVPSTVTALKSEDSGTRALPHSPTPLPHPASPRSASPPPSSPRQPKQEAAEEGDVGQREQRGAQKPAAGPFQGMYSGECGENGKTGHSCSITEPQILTSNSIKSHETISHCMVTDSCIFFIGASDLPPGYPFQSITGPFGSALSPYHISAPAAATADVVPVPRTRSPLSSASLPSAHLHSRLLDTDVKPQKLELSKVPYLKQESGRHDVVPESPGPLCRSCSPVLGQQDGEDGSDVAKPQLLPLRVSSPPQQQCERLEDVRKEEKEGGPIKMEAPSYSCTASYPRPPLAQAEPQAKVIRAPEGYLSWTAADPHTQESALVSHEQTSTSACADKQPDASIKLLPPGQRELGRESPVTLPPVSNSPLAVPEDPMAGMFALLTASEMARARPRTPAPALPTQMASSPLTPDGSSTGALEMVALEGMALLSQVAQQEMQPLSQEQGELLRRLTVSDLQVDDQDGDFFP